VCLALNANGTLPASAFSWTILFHHESHLHPAGGPFTNTKTGTLQIPTSGHDFQGSTSYEIVLTVTDWDGLTAFTSVTVVPDKVNLSFDTVSFGSDRRNRRDQEASTVHSRRRQGFSAHDYCTDAVEWRNLVRVRFLV
jgi:hypothetical protein